MVVTVSPNDPRSVRALAVLATADRWTKGHRKSDGTAFFVVPGSNGAVYWTDTRVCTCPDFAKNAPQEMGFACKHIRAARLWKLQQDGEQAQAPKTSRKPAQCRVCTATLPNGVLSGVCDACQDFGLMCEGVAAIKAAFGSTADAMVQSI